MLVATFNSTSTAATPINPRKAPIRNHVVVSLNGLICSPAHRMSTMTPRRNSDTTIVSKDRVALAICDLTPTSISGISFRELILPQANIRLDGRHRQVTRDEPSTTPVAPKPGPTKAIFVRWVGRRVILVAHRCKPWGMRSQSVKSREGGIQIEPVAAVTSYQVRATTS